MAEIYTQNILVAPQYCKNGEAPIDAPAELGKVFIDGTFDVLNRARLASNTFARLIEAIVQGRHAITIYMARNKEASLEKLLGAKAEHNMTFDNQKQLLLQRVEGSSYAKNRSEIVKALNTAFLGTGNEEAFGKVMNVELKTFDWEDSPMKHIQQKIYNHSESQIRFDQVLQKYINIVKTMPKQKPSGKIDDGVIPDRKTRNIRRGIVDPRFDCEVFSPDAHTPAIYYPPLWKRIGHDLHIDHALNQYTGLIRTEKEKKVRQLLKRDVGLLDEPFLREAELRNPKGYMMSKLELEDKLEPNEGCPSNIVFNLRAKRVSPSLPKQPKGTQPDINSPWHFRPVEVGLAHELIHAWRNSSGRTVFTFESLEDESMVIGTPNLHSDYRGFTENAIRDELKLVQRPEDTRPTMFFE